MISRFRGALVISAFALNIGLAASPASAALDMVIAPSVTATKPLSDCTTRAESALKSAMQTVTEAGTGSGHWVGVTRMDGSVSATAVVECHPVDAGYRASFTCAVQVPPNADTASALCSKIATAFNA